MEVRREAPEVWHSARIVPPLHLMHDMLSYYVYD